MKMKMMMCVSGWWLDCFWVCEIGMKMKVMCAGYYEEEEGDDVTKMLMMRQVI